MTDALIDHVVTVSIGGRSITNLRFVDDIDGLAGREEELADLVERLDKTSTAFGMQINAEKTQLMTSNTNGFSPDIRINLYTHVSLEDLHTNNVVVSYHTHAAATLPHDFWEVTIVAVFFLLCCITLIISIVRTRRTFSTPSAPVIAVLCIICFDGPPFVFDRV